MTCYVLFDEKNRPVHTFHGPLRLAKWDKLPEGWSIEELYGDVSRGTVSLEYVKRHAAEMRLSLETPISGHLDANLFVKRILEATS